MCVFLSLEAVQCLLFGWKLWVLGMCADLSLCLVRRGLGGGGRPWMDLLVCLGKTAWFPGMVDRPKARTGVRSWQLQGGEARSLRSLFSRL